MNRLKDKKILIIGGSQGIGRSAVIECVREGAIVAATWCSSKQSADTLITELSDYSECLSLYQMDVTHEKSVSDGIAHIVKELGGLDVLVYCAGITSDSSLPFMSLDMWNDVINVNLSGAFLAAKASVLPFAKNKPKGGSIIFLSSVSGLSGIAGQANYSASKAGLIGLTKSLAKEFGRYNIRINSIAPGFVETDMLQSISQDKQDAFKKEIPLARFAMPVEIAKSILFFASDDSSYITGQTLVIDGGMT